MKVLLIEDNPGDVRLIREMLSESRNISLEIEHADHLSTGLDRIAQGGLDILLLDLGLPDSQGLETLSTVHKQAPGMPIVVMTGLSDETIGIQAVQEGAQDYLIKGRVDSNLLTRSILYSIERNRIEEEREKLIKQLQEALANIKTLSGMLPICASCKKIRDDKGYWNRIETYISEHADVLFTHGMCPDCAKKAYEELEKFKRQQNM